MTRSGRSDCRTGLEPQVLATFLLRPRSCEPGLRNLDQCLDREHVLADPPVVPRGADRDPAGAEGDVAHGPRVSPQDEALATRLDVPHPDRLVLARCRDEHSVGRELYRRDRPLMSSEDGDALAVQLP